MKEMTQKKVFHVHKTPRLVPMAQECHVLWCIKTALLVTEKQLFFIPIHGTSCALAFEP